MLFSEKINLTHRLIRKFSKIEPIVLGPLEEEYNYRNKSVYSFYIDDNYLDQETFKIIGLEHSKIIQYINIKINRDFEKNLKILDVYLKNNSNSQFQICFCIKCICLCNKIEMEKKITQYLFSLIKSLVLELNINIVSCYYHIFQKGLGLKDKEFEHFYGIPKLTETIEISGKKLEVVLSPYSFSRINYSNSCLVYQTIYNLCTMYDLSFSKNKYLLFGRDIYFPIKMIEMLGYDWTAITHCPITYKDVIDDIKVEDKCLFVKKKDYLKNINLILTSDSQKWNIILTSSRNGLGLDMCQMLDENWCKIGFLIYISCNTNNMEKDMLILTNKYKLQKVFISNEFSHTNYCNTICVLTS